jgi:hypothetical protein
VRLLSVGKERCVPTRQQITNQFFWRRLVPGIKAPAIEISQAVVDELDKLKRDFPGKMFDLFPDLELVAYEFVYR